MLESIRPRKFTSVAQLFIVLFGLSLALGHNYPFYSALAFAFSSCVFALISFSAAVADLKNEATGRLFIFLCVVFALSTVFAGAAAMHMKGMFVTEFYFTFGGDYAG